MQDADTREVALPEWLSRRLYVWAEWPDAVCIVDFEFFIQ
jgi:hypothetical protein